jgi:transcriptional regulator with XRE-family HTH domain
MIVNGGDLVYLARARAGLTQAQLGARVGMAQNAVSRIERGDVDAGFGSVTELVRACGFEPHVTLATRDPSYARDVRRRLALTPLQRLELGVNHAHVAQSMRRTALAGEAAGEARGSREDRQPPREQAVSSDRHGEWHEWPFEPLVVLRALGRHGVAYVLIGGLAAVLQASPLPTYDIDIAPAPGSANARRLQAALAELDATALTDDDDAKQALRRPTDVSFSTPLGYIDLHHRPAGFDSYAALRRNAVPMQLEPDLSVLVSPLRDIIRSRTAAGDQRQLPALEAALELA